MSLRAIKSRDCFKMKEEKTWVKCKRKEEERGTRGPGEENESKVSMKDGSGRREGVEFQWRSGGGAGGGAGPRGWTEGEIKEAQRDDKCGRVRPNKRTCAAGGSAIELNWLK